MGHKAIVYGGILYVLGGYDPNGRTYFNDLYGLDLNSYLLGSTQLNGQPPQWVQLLNNGAAGMISVRGAFSWDVYGHTTIVFGGIYDPSPTLRTLYNDVWVWSPGVVNQLSPWGGAPKGWAILAATGQNGGPLPPCRYGHASGILSDQVRRFHLSMLDLSISCCAY